MRITIDVNDGRGAVSEGAPGAVRVSTADADHSGGAAALEPTGQATGQEARYAITQEVPARNGGAAPTAELGEIGLDAEAYEAEAGFGGEPGTLHGHKLNEAGSVEDDTEA